MNDELLLAGSLATRLSVEQPERRLLMRLLAATCLSLPIVASLAQAPREDVPGAVRGALANWIAAFNRGDPTGVYFASDAVMVRGNGTFNGATVINDMEQRESKAGLRLTLVVDHVQILNSTTALAVRRYTVMPPGAPGSPIPGVSMHTLQRVGDRWQVRGASFTRTQPPPPGAAPPSLRNERCPCRPQASPARVADQSEACISLVAA